jgi:hypothetical protein
MNRKETGFCIWKYFLLVSLFAGMASVASAEGKAGPIKGSGCVSPGVEAGCLMLTDSNDSTKVYNLFLAGEKPAIGTAISFQGTAHTGVNICQQGTPVNVTKWTRLEIPCPAGRKK